MTWSSEKKKAYMVVYRAANAERLRANTAAWREANPDKYKAGAAAWRATNRERCREIEAGRRDKDPEAMRAKKRRNNLAANYGLTPAEVDVMTEAQHGLCASCGGPPVWGKGKRLHVDHKRGTKCVRALLCQGCNTALGLLDESPEKVLALYAYILKYVRP